jgi:zinc protease
MGGISEYDYPNGLRVLLFPDPSSPKVTVNVVYLVGSRHEGYGESGMAHLLEHLNFIRSTHDREIKKELTDHGAQWNGTTSYDRTNYFETITATDENLKWALDLEAERMVNMRIEKQLLDTEMTVVRNEFERGENSPQRILDERVLSTAYLWHNYGKSTIGSREDIEKVPIDRLAAFYKKYYQPDNAVVVIAGKFDEAKTLGWVADTMGKIARPTRKLDETYTVEPPQDGQRTVELRRVGGNQELIIAWHAPAMAHPDSAALEVLTGIMETGGGRGGGGSGRLYKALLDNKKAVGVNVGYDELHDPGYVEVIATLSKDQSLDDAKKISFETMQSVIAEPPTKDEVERVKSRILQSMEMSMSNSQGAAMQMTSMISSGDWRLYFLNYDELKKVTPEDVVRVAKAYIKDSNSTIGEFIPTAEQPERAIVPDAPSIDSQLNGFKNTLSISAGESFDPTPANIEKHVTRFKLADGLKVVMLPKTTRGGLVNVFVTLNFGDENSLAGKRTAAGIAGSLLMRGTKQHTRQQIQDEMVKLNAQIQVSGSLTGATAAFQTTEANLPAALALAAEILRDPTFPESEFDQVKKQRLTGLEQAKTEPANLARIDIERIVNPYPKTNIRYVSTIDEDIAALNAVTLDDVKKFHQQFYGASNGEMVIVGQFDPAKTHAVAETLLGNWKSPAPYKRIIDSYSKVEAANHKIETPDKQNAQFEAEVRIQMRDTDPDYPAMVLANYMFGGSITARAPDRIRNREGLSYGINSRFSAPSDGGDIAIFGLIAIANPKNTPKVEASFKDELAKTVSKGYTAAEVAAAKKAYLDERRVGRAQDAGLLRVLAIREEFDRTMKWDEDMDAKLEALTADQINAAMKRHIDVNAVSIAKAGDFKAAGVY